MIEVVTRRENEDDYRGKTQPVCYGIRLNGQLRYVSKADLIRTLDLHLPEEEAEEKVDLTPQGNGHATATT